MESKKNNNAVFTGCRGFRSAGEDKEKFSVLTEKFGKDLIKERFIKEIDSECLRPNDFKTLIDKDYLMKSLLAHSLEEGNKI